MKEIGILLLIILINSFFVITEIALISSRKSKLNSMARRGYVGAQKAAGLVNQPDVFLSTVQVGITLVSVLIGIYGGTTLVEKVEVHIASLPYLERFSHAISYVLVLIVVTYCTVLGELVPKRIALIYPEVIASYTSYGMLFFMKICYPLVHLLTVSVRFVLRICKVRAKETKISIEELRSIFNQAEFSSMLEATEYDIMKRITHLSNTQVGAIMTPRNKMVCIDIKDGEAKNIIKIRKNQFHYFPVIDGGLHSFIGIISVRSLFNHSVTNAIIAQQAINFPIVYVPEVARVWKLMDILKKKKARIAIVLDEYGDIEGLVTLNDALKILVGDLAIGRIDKQPDILRHADGTYTVSGGILIDEVISLLSLSSLPGEEDEEYRTLASFILKQMQHFPKNGDSIEALGWVFKVIKIEKHRIESVLIFKSPEEQSLLLTKNN